MGINEEGKRRDRIEIVAEILRLAQNDVKKTRIMYRGNLSYAAVNEYLEFMLKRGLLDKFEKEKTGSHDLYRCAKKGQIFLEHYNQINEMFNVPDSGMENFVKPKPPYVTPQSASRNH